MPARNTTRPMARVAVYLVTGRGGGVGGGSTRRREGAGVVWDGGALLASHWKILTGLVEPFLEGNADC